MKIPIRIANIGTGSTIDISSSGVAFILDATLEPGSFIDFAVAMEQDSRPFELHCGGTVVRVEQRGGYVFTAATIENLAVRNLHGH